MTTAPQLLWQAFGSPAPGGKTGSKYREESCTGACATCGASIVCGVPFAGRRNVAGIDNDTFSGHAEYARWGTHVCMACAWLYGDPKRAHRSVLAIGGRGWWPTIAQDIDGRPRWRRILSEIARAAPGTPMTGVLTTDPKPRLWPRCQVACCGAPGLYIHAPDDDLSGWHPLNVSVIAETLASVDRAIAAGATKTAVRRGLWSAPKLADAIGLDAIAALESRVAPRRGRIEFAVAVLIA